MKKSFGADTHNKPILLLIVCCCFDEFYKVVSYIIIVTVIYFYLFYSVYPKLSFISIIRIKNNKRKSATTQPVNQVHIVLNLPQ